MNDVTMQQTASQGQGVLSEPEVTRAVICSRVVEFRGTDLGAIIASVTSAFESGAFQGLPDSFTVRVSGGELSPQGYLAFSSRP